MRFALQYGFLAWTLVAAFHHNVVRPYFLERSLSRTVGPDSPAHAPALAYDTSMGVAKRLGLGSLWRMYSPVRRTVLEIRWQALDSSGRWVTLSAPGVSPARRDERSLADAILWDFKRARIGDNYFITRSRDVLPEVYVTASRDEIVRELGEMPRALRVQVYEAAIPPPDRRGDWDPDHVVYDRLAWERVFR